MKEMIQYKGYTAAIHLSVGDEVFYGNILGIDDIVSFEGASEEDVKNSFIEAVDDYLEACEQIGKKA